jgi:GNAT superfamily N-acetyltransferase
MFLLSIQPRISYIDDAITITVMPTYPQFSLPQDETLVLRPVTPDDDGFLLSVYESTRSEELAQVEWQPGHREAFLRWQFDLQRQEYEARFPDAEYYLIVINDEPAGRIWIGEDPKQIRLLDIALLTQFQNRGAGTALLGWLIEKANASAKPLRHMVFMLNSDAHRFYERLGFVVIEDLGAYKHMEWSEPSAVAGGPN